jgi:hypothetical protein
MSKILLAVLLMSILTGDAALEVAGTGRLLDAYALADGGNVTVTLFDNAYRLQLFTRYNAADGSHVEQRLELPTWQNGPPVEWRTEICGGRLHVWLSWDEQSQVLHYAWDLPIEQINKLYLPLVCRGS